MGWPELTERGRRAARARDHLADEKAYSDAVDALKGDQIVTVWADVARTYAVVPKDELLLDNPFFSVDELKPAGQVVLGAHAENDAVEVVGRTIGLTTGIKGFDQMGAAGRGSDMVQSFPEDSAVAFSETGLGMALAEVYTANEPTLRDLDAFGAFDMLNKAGVSLPADFTAVLGDEVAGYFAGRPDDPRMALRLKTSSPARARQVISRLAATAAGHPIPMREFYAEAPGGYIVGFPEGFLPTSIGGRLGTSKAFRDAVPDAAGSPFVFFADVPKAIDIADEDVPEEVRQLMAVGLTAHAEGENASFRLRVTFV